MSSQSINWIWWTENQTTKQNGKKLRLNFINMNKKIKRDSSLVGCSSTKKIEHEIYWNIIRQFCTSKTHTDITHSECFRHINESKNKKCQQSRFSAINSAVRQPDFFCSCQNAQILKRIYAFACYHWNNEQKSQRERETKKKDALKQKDTLSEGPFLLLAENRTKIKPIIDGVALVNCQTFVTFNGNILEVTHLWDVLFFGHRFIERCFNKSCVKAIITAINVIDVTRHWLIPSNSISNSFNLSHVGIFCFVWFRSNH